MDFDHVYFKYHKDSGAWNLEDVCLHIDSGMTVGILGGTGSAKSSLVSLISRLYDVTAGQVLVGGRDVREYDLEALRNQVAVVLQKNVLFSGTILENLRWGDEHATLEDCQRACRLACADEFIQRLPQGYDTPLEQGGANLSGGQRQRLLIARALADRPEILILDNADSALDYSTAAALRQALRRDFPCTTLVIISERVSAVREADCILVLENGRIDAQGCHDALMASCRRYQRMAKLQMGGDVG